MVKISWPKSRAAAAVIIGSCVIAFLFDRPSFLPYTERSQTPFLRRELLQGLELSSGQQPGDGPSIYPWAKNLIRPLSVTPEPSRETVLFWHIPKSGGSTAKAIYRCMGKTIDIESQREDILRAKDTGLVSSGKVDIIFSSFPDFAIQNLFDPSHKTRVLALFRHPIDRLISKFYYLQIATWERTYRPEWKDMDILDWVKSGNTDNDHMVKKLAGKVQREESTETDLRLAKETIRSRFIVGLMQEMEESTQRFNTVMGINDETDRYHKTCMEEYFGAGMEKKNSNSHPKVKKGSPAWQLLAEKNAFDIQLYEYILELYEEQREIIDSYASSIVLTPA